MNREMRAIGRWLTMMMIVVGLLGVLPTAAMAQDAATPDAVTDEQTSPPPVEDPVVAPTEIPTEPPVEHDPVIIPTEIPAEAPTEPPIVDDPVVVPTEEPTAPPSEEGRVEAVASPAAPSIGLQAIDAQQIEGTVFVTAIDSNSQAIPGAFIRHRSFNRMSWTGQTMNVVW